MTMVNRSPPPLTQSESALNREIRAEIELGLTLSADPTNAGLPELAIRITTIHSPWFARACRVCGDKFRDSDRVRLCPRCGEPYHDDDQYDLHCWRKHFANGGMCKEGRVDDRFSEQVERCEFRWSQPLPEETAATSGEEGPPPHTPPSVQLIEHFVSGVETLWRPFGEHKRLKVPSGSPLIGRKCPWCRFGIRVGDWVVECPCASACGTYFHQDVFRHLTCWNEWNGVEGHDYCPNTGAPYPKVTGTEAVMDEAA